ncbi:MAG TPA: hypothetical protein PLC98_12535 [Anaerolineales bacterium]|nr:hypothetical protein [Anaerolineales bacterium]
MKSSMNWQRVMAYSLRMLTVIAMTGFVAWLPGSRTVTTTTTTTDNVLVSWGGTN